MSDSSAGGIGNEDEPSRKRSRDDTALEVGAPAASAAATPASPTGLDFAKMSRSERKRHRERKRRSDVNKGFDELMSVLLEIDPDVRAEAEEKAIKGQWKGIGRDGSSEDNMLSRVELIGRAVEVLRRVHTENEERKQIIATLMRRSAGGVNLPAQRMGGSISNEVRAVDTSKD